MKQTRVQPLNQTYHQLTQLLHESLLCLYAAGSLQDQIEPLQKVELTMSLYERHIAKEEAILFSILYEYEPYVTAILLHNYKLIEKQVACLRTMIASDNNEVDVAEEQNDHRLLYRFNDFLNTCMAQMKEHQSLIYPVLWRYYSDAELEQMATSFAISKPLFTYSKTTKTPSRTYSLAI